mmetsp:Transcript_33284/g.49596  ORF Transcript_33284/g.49596 Transcript_33284/m.49596 type:complete len:203 (+) Transcript_33284:91-699(+)
MIVITRPINHPICQHTHCTPTMFGIHSPKYCIVRITQFHSSMNEFGNFWRKKKGTSSTVSPYKFPSCTSCCYSAIVITLLLWNIGTIHRHGHGTFLISTSNNGHPRHAPETVTIFVVAFSFAAEFFYTTLQPDGKVWLFFGITFLLRIFYSIIPCCLGSISCTFSSLFITMRLIGYSRWYRMRRNYNMNTIAFFSFSSSLKS